jgi:hypothetical protein
MKRILAVTAACVLAVSVYGSVLAQPGKEGGCSKCNQGSKVDQAGPGSAAIAATAETDSYRMFMQKTLDLRQEMMNKRFDLQRENLKGSPDAVRVAGIKADITSIQARINLIRVQSGIADEGKRDGECFKMDGSCFKTDGGCAKQNGMGGCNGQPCGQK